MTIPTPLDAGPLRTDDDVLARATALVQRAHRRQLWLFLIDEDDRQAPNLPVLELPPRPVGPGARHLPDLLCGAMHENGVEQLALVYERVGRPQLTEADRAWLRLMIAGCALHEIRLRGPLLAYSHGVRWIAPEDLA